MVVAVAVVLVPKALEDQNLQYFRFQYLQYGTNQEAEIIAAVAAVKKEDQNLPKDQNLQNLAVVSIEEEFHE